MTIEKKPKNTEEENRKLVFVFIFVLTIIWSTLGSLYVYTIDPYWLRDNLYKIYGYAAIGILLTYTIEKAYYYLTERNKNYIITSGLIIFLYFFTYINFILKVFVSFEINDLFRITILTGLLRFMDSYFNSIRDFFIKAD